jgi:4-amino-4-deoxy-L-arabinose transferase-like glycosyltransferase
MSVTQGGKRPLTISSEYPPRFLKCALFALACYFLFVYIAIALARMHYPFELEWMEGGSLEQVRRILAGQKLYVAPSLEFIPFIYPPLYYYLAAGFAAIIGLSFFPLRLLSFLASLGCFWVIFRIVREETRDNLAGFIAACLFAATFRLSGAWFDLGRTDTLFMFFTLTALYCIRFRPSTRSFILAGALMACAFQSKQTALAISLAMMAGALLLHGRRAFYFVGAAVIITVASLLVLDLWHGGWARFYLIELPQRHTMAARMLAAFWTRDLLARLAIVCTAAAFYLLVEFQTGNKRKALFYLLIVGAMVGVSWVGRLNRGGYNNVLLPAYAGLAILFGLAFHHAVQRARSIPSHKESWLEGLIFLLGIVQFVFLMYNPYRQIPTAQDVAAGEQLLETIRQAPGEVLIPYHNYLLSLAGKPGQAHWAGIEELIGLYGGSEMALGTELLQQMRQKIERQEYSLLILDEKWDVEGYYVKWRPAFDDPNVFFPVTGWRIRPETIFVPAHE